MRRCLLIIVCLAALSGCGDDPANNGNNDPDPTWEQAFDASEAGWLLSVAGSASDDVWTVGGTPDDGAIWHFDGAEWSEQAVPDGVPLLNWVHVFDDGTPIIVGNDGVVLRRESDGWAVEQTPTEQDLWGVWGAGPDELWAVGGDGRSEDAATVLRYRDGTWNMMQLPDMERPNVRAFYKVWGTGADNVYIVGQRGAVLRWDGSQLKELLVGTSQDLISLWGTGPDDIVAVGGRANGVVARFDGAEWTSESLAPLPGLNGIWMDEQGAWVAGNAGTLGRLDVDALEVEQISVQTQLDLHAVFGTGDGAHFSVGGSLQSPVAPYEGVALSRGATP